MSEPETPTAKPPRGRLPWARIWAETPVILVSILMAFSIEAWWQNRLEGREVSEYLAALWSEFEQGRTQLDSVSAKNRQSIAATLEMVGLSEDAARAIRPDSALALYWAMMESATFDPSLGVLTAVQSSGLLDDIDNVALRGSLGGWPGLVEDSKEDVYPVWESSLGVVNRWANLDLGIKMLELSEGVGGPQTASEFLIAVASDAETRNRLAARSAFNRVYQLELDGLAGRIEEILTLLDGELQR